MNSFMFVTTHYHPNVVGGAELSVQTLAEELSRQGKRVVVVSLSTTNADSVDEVNGIKVYRVAVTNFYQPFPIKHRPPLQPQSPFRSENRILRSCSTTTAVPPSTR